MQVPYELPGFPRGPGVYDGIGRWLDHFLTLDSEEGETTAWAERKAFSCYNPWHLFKTAVFGRGMKGNAWHSGSGTCRRAT